MPISDRDLTHLVGYYQRKLDAIPNEAEGDDQIDLYGALGIERPQPTTFEKAAPYLSGAAEIGLPVAGALLAPASGGLSLAATGAAGGMAGRYIRQQAGDYDDVVIQRVIDQVKKDKRAIQPDEIASAVEQARNSVTSTLLPGAVGGAANAFFPAGGKTVLGAAAKAAGFGAGETIARQEAESLASGQGLQSPDLKSAAIGAVFGGAVGGGTKKLDDILRARRAPVSAPVEPVVDPRLALQQGIDEAMIPSPALVPEPQVMDEVGEALSRRPAPVIHQPGPPEQLRLPAPGDDLRVNLAKAGYTKDEIEPIVNRTVGGVEEPLPRFDTEPQMPVLRADDIPPAPTGNVRVGRAPQMPDRPAPRIQPVISQQPVDDTARLIADLPGPTLQQMDAASARLAGGRQRAPQPVVQQPPPPPQQVVSKMPDVPLPRFDEPQMPVLQAHDLPQAPPPVPQASPTPTLDKLLNRGILQQTPDGIALPDPKGAYGSLRREKIENFLNSPTLPLEEKEAVLKALDEDGMFSKTGRRLGNERGSVVSGAIVPLARAGVGAAVGAAVTPEEEGGPLAGAVGGAALGLAAGRIRPKATKPLTSGMNIHPPPAGNVTKNGNGVVESAQGTQQRVSLGPDRGFRPNVPTADEAGETAARFARAEESLAEGSAPIRPDRVRRVIDKFAEGGDLKTAARELLQEEGDRFSIGKFAVQNQQETIDAGRKLGWDLEPFLRSYKGQPLSAKETAKAYELMVEQGVRYNEAVDALRGADTPDNLQRATDELLKYYAIIQDFTYTGTEAARALSIRRALKKNALGIEDAVKELFANSQAKGGKFAPDARQFIEMVDGAARNGGAKAVKKMTDARTSDAFFEAYVGGILSWNSALRATAGNFAHQWIRYAEGAAEAGVNAILKGAFNKTLTPLEMADVRAEIQGAHMAAKEAGLAAVEAIRTGALPDSLEWLAKRAGKKTADIEEVLKRRPAIEQGLSKLGMDESGKAAKAIGTAFRYPLHLLEGADAFFATMHKRGGLYKEAFRAARAAKISAQEEPAFVSRFMDAPPEEAVGRAEEYAREMVFRQKTGKAIVGLNILKREIPGLRWLVPFTTTPGNVASTAFLRPVKAAKRVVTGQAQEGDVGATLMATGIASTAIWAAMNGVLTGDTPTDSIERARWESEGVQPYSVNFGGMSIPIRSVFDPISSQVMFLADAVGAMRRSMEKGEGSQVWDEKLTNAAGSLVGGLTNAILSQSSLTSVADFIDAANGDDSKMATFLKNYATGLLPMSGTMRQVALLGDEQEQRRATRPAEAFASRIPGLRNDNPVMPAPLARERTSTLGERIGRALLPTFPRFTEEDKPLREIERLHKAGYEVPSGATGRTVTVKKQPVELSRREQASIQKNITKESRPKLEKLLQSDSYGRNADEKKAKRLSDVVEKGRSKARSKRAIKELLNKRQ